MSIGARLKSERKRLAFNQDEFAGRAGVSKRALIEWEKGSTFPSAAALEALNKAGVDIQYVVTGRPSGGTVSGMTEAEATATLDRADRLLRESGRLDDEVGRALLDIAEDDELSDKLRARADLAIRFAFKDSEEAKAAQERQETRTSRVQADMARAEAIIADAVAAAGWSPPADLRGHLVNLVRFYKVDSETITVILYTVARLLPDEGR